MSIFGFLKREIGVDLGTANTLIYTSNGGIVLNQPSIIAYNEKDKRIIAVGEEARKMLGRAPENIKVVRPLRNGVISDFEMAQAMLKGFIMKAVPKQSFFTQTTMVVGVPSGVTNVEKRAVEETAYQVGAKRAYVVEEPMAAAIGSGLKVEDATGCMVIDIGGGTTDIAIISLGGIVTRHSMDIAGDSLNEDIITYVKNKYKLLIGERTAEQAKMNVGCAWLDADSEIRETQLSGRDLLTGLPKKITLNSHDALEALKEALEKIGDGLKQTLEKAPPELVSDIIDNGIMMTGGGALLPGLTEYLHNITGVTMIVSDDPLGCVAVGTGASINIIKKIEHDNVSQEG